MSEAYERGMRVRRRVLGDAHVDRVEAAKTSFEAPFQRMITETAWGQVWAGDTLSPRERSLITLALLATLGQWDEFAMHVRACANTGASQDDIREALMHVAIYAGLPAANHVFGIARLIQDGAASESSLIDENNMADEEFAQASGESRGGEK